MRWLSLLIVSFFVGMLSAEAQRYLPGMRGIQVMGGLIERDGYYLHGGYSWYTRHKNRWAGGAEYLQRNYAWEAGHISVAQFTAEFGFYKLLLSDMSKSFFTAVGITALTGYETVNWNTKRLPNGAIISNADRWLYGATAAVEFEYYLDDRYIFLATAKQRMSGAGSTHLDFDQFDKEIFAPGRFQSFGG